MASRSLTPYRSRSIEPFRPVSPFLSFYQQANRLFEDMFHEFDDTREALSGVLAPSIDITQSDHEIRVTAELPGVKEDDVDLSVDDDVLTIRAEKRIEREDGKDVRHVRERAYGTFQRSLRLPRPVDPEQVRAHFANGVLTVILPRTEPESARKKIAIDRGPPPEPAAGPGSESKH